MDSSKIFTQTERLLLREMTQADFESLCKILQDPDVMYAYEGAFNNAETQDWLDRQCARYRQDGFGLCAVVLKATGEMIGQCGLTWQEIPGQKVLEIGYLLQKAHWHRGYALEAAIACKEYAFAVLKADAVYSIIRDGNIPSQKVARRNGMAPVGSFVKHYRGVHMPHTIFCVRRTDD